MDLALWPWPTDRAHAHWSGWQRLCAWLLLIGSGLAGCSVSVRQTVPSAGPATDYAFSGTNFTMRTPTVGGIRRSVPIVVPASSGSVASSFAYRSVAVGLDLDRVRLAIVPTSVPDALSWLGVEAWYKWPLRPTRWGELRLLTGIGWQNLAVRSVWNGRLDIPEVWQVGLGDRLQPGDAVTYEATDERQAWQLGIGLEHSLLGDWLYAYGQLQVALATDSLRRESLRVAVRTAQGGKDDTLDLLQDDRFDRTVQQAGIVRSGLELPLITVGLGIGVVLPPWRVVQRPRKHSSRPPPARHPPDASSAPARPIDRTWPTGYPAPW
jgi:hypothetical protein